MFDTIEATTILQDALSNSQVPERDRDFAADLLRKGARYGLSDKQAYWVRTLASRVGKPQEKPQAVEIGDLSGVQSLFAKAHKHLKKPAVVIFIEKVGEVRLAEAGARARQPGTINVATNAPYGESTWFGRIQQSGSFEPSPRTDLPAGLVAALQRFAAEPAKVAAEHGHLTGKCCFCNRHLEDERSTAVGYGPVCADHYELPWGSKEEAESLPTESPTAGFKFGGWINNPAPL